MPQKSGFFDTTADDPRDYPAREFAEYFARFVGNGIFSGGTKLKVSATGTNANVKIETGFGWINGYLYSVYDEALTLTVQPATNADRIDRVILRLDTSTPVRAIRAMILQGNPAASPTVPAITRSGDIYDLSLAQILVKSNTSVVLDENITDERLNSAVCGVVTGLIQQADTTAIFNQFQAWLNTKTVEYAAEWRAFLETVQDEGFATTQYVDNRVLTGGYGATTNSANAYSVTLVPAPTALVAGLRATVRINAANTGAATLNVNGLGAKSILKSNGTALTSGFLKVNSVYSVVYNGTAFILQGEGGEYGTAVAGEVLSGKTIGTETGLVTGTMPNRSAESAHQLAKLTEVWQGDRAFFMPPDGYFDGQSWVYALTPDLLPSNIRSGKSILGVAGTLNEGPKYATGIATLSDFNIRILFNLERAGTYSTTYFVVSNLSFRPNRIIVKIPMYSAQPFVYTTKSRNGAGGYNLFSSFNNVSAERDSVLVYEHTGQTIGSSAYVNDTGFLLPAFSMALTQVEWEAFGV